MIEKDEFVKSIHRNVVCDTCNKGLKANADMPLNRLVDILRHMCYIVSGNANDGFTVTCLSCQRKDKLNEAEEER